MSDETKTPADHFLDNFISVAERHAGVWATLECVTANPEAVEWARFELDIRDKCNNETLKVAQGEDGRMVRQWWFCSQAKNHHQWGGTECFTGERLAIEPQRITPQFPSEARGPEGLEPPGLVE